MKLYHPPSGLSRGLDFLINADWTPAQALAVVELLDDLRDRVWAHYEVQLYEQLREDRLNTERSERTERSDDDPPF